MLALSAMLMLWVPQGHADDTDVYTGGAATGDVPNVLFVIDNGANFEANGGSGLCTAYNSGGAPPSLGSNNGGIQQCALVNAIEALPSGTVNIGLLVGNADNFAQGYSGMVASHAADYTACHQSTGYGGCVIRPLKLMDTANKADLISFIKSWKTTGQDGSTSFNIKAAGNKTANMMQEAWAYYNGKIGMSGRDYSTSLLSSGCQKNFIIFVANAAGSSSTPADTPAGADAEAALAMVQVAATTAQKTKITETATFSSLTCGVTSLASGNQASNWSSSWMDEWARLMYQQDGYGAGQGVQSIVTYGVGIIGTNCKPDYPALLTTAARHAGGKYFSASSAVALTDVLFQILNEIQAVNSVFAAASLPVSVNAQGTYLNQIFLGMFRPDAKASPRWMGNLKQFQLVDSDGVLVLGDATGARALSAAGTGFISTGSQSYWTSKNLSTLPDDGSLYGDGNSVGGFFRKDGSTGSTNPFDLPDGEFVEKGGVAQKLRLESLTASYLTAADDANNPRRLYTYCPSGTGCQAALSTHADNKFATTMNTAIGTNPFGDSTTAAILSIVRTGTTALVTTNGNHGFTAGTTSVTINSNVDPPEYRVTQVIAAPSSATTFTITGLPDYPDVSSSATYVVATIAPGGVGISSMTRLGTGTGNTDTVRVVTSGVHAFLNGSTVTISNTSATRGTYNSNWTISVSSSDPCPMATCFEFPVTITPTTPSSAGYKVAIGGTSAASRTVSAVIRSGSTATATYGGATGQYHVGQPVIVSGTNNNKYDGSQVVTAVGSNTFSFSVTGNPANCSFPCTGAGVVADTTQKTLTGTLTRSSTADTVTVTGTGAPSNWLGVNGGTKQVTITQPSLINSELAYAGTFTIACTTVGCTSFTYSISNPGTSPTNTITVGVTSTVTPTSGVSQTLSAAGSITRSGTTATLNGLTANLFGNAVNATKAVTISTSGSPDVNEAAYVDSWTITCTNATCTTATFAPVTLTPASPAGGVNMQAIAAGTAPDKNTLINWVRGQDNYGDELGPGSVVKVRPSIHGDVLHSRPTVINYGTNEVPNVVVFYGSNDGVFRAVNGNQTAAITAGAVSVPAGGELWGLILPEHFGALNRQRINTPELKLPTTLLASAEKKDYFVDGPPGTFQLLKADGTIDKAYLYLTMRRGGRFIYAIDVSVPTAPVFMWRKSFSDSEFDELGQTWSLPKVALVKGYANPVLIFGGGYDPAEDDEPPSTRTMGRGVYVLDAKSGELVWKATIGDVNACGVTGVTLTNGAAQAACQLMGMTHSIPSDIAIMDRNLDGKSDRLYFGDMGGNVWRVDFESDVLNTPEYWRATKVAALGCLTGTCPSSGTTPRKFLFPPSVLNFGNTGVPGSYDALLLGSGDREHPLRNTTNLQSSYYVTNRFYMIKDTLTKVTPSSAELAAIVLRTEKGDDFNGHLFQAFTSPVISTMERASATMTVTTAGNHGFASGNTVVIDGLTDSVLDGHYKIISAGTNTFTYSSIGSNATINVGTVASATVAVPFGTNSAPGFYSYLASGEKVVNAALTVLGTTFFGTNRPIPPSNICVSNLGEARGYAFKPFLGTSSSVVYDGGGLPPSGVSGYIAWTKADGTSGYKRFCMGCGGGEGDSGTSESKSSLGGGLKATNIPKKPQRTYWYRK